MNFKQATDALLEAITLDDLAALLGISVQSVRQARAAKDSSAHRPPPVGWEAAVRKLAIRKQEYFKKLAENV